MQTLFMIFKAISISFLFTFRGGKILITFSAALIVNNLFLRRPSIELAGRVLTWQPKVTLETGLNKTIDYFKKQKFNLNDDNII